MPFPPQAVLSGILLQCTCQSYDDSISEDCRSMMPTWVSPAVHVHVVNPQLEMLPLAKAGFWLQIYILKLQSGSWCFSARQI